MKLGIKSVTMDDMAKQLGISKKTLYNHFTDKSELVEDIIKAKLTEDRMAFQKASENDINTIDELFMVSKFVIETFKSVNPTVFYDLKKLSAMATFDRPQMEFVYNEFLKNIEKGMREGYTDWYS